MQDALKGVKLLIVDDDQTVREVLRRSFANAGAEVILKSNGHEALDYLRDNQVSVLVTDIVMPEMDGIALLCEAKKLYPVLPVCLVTGQELDLTSRKAASLGAEHLLKKPFSNVDLVRRIQGTMERLQRQAEELERTRTIKIELDQTDGVSR